MNKTILIMKNLKVLLYSNYVITDEKRLRYTLFKVKNFKQ